MIDPAWLCAVLPLEVHPRALRAQRTAAEKGAEPTQQEQPRRQNLSISQLQEEAKKRSKKVELEKFDYSVDNVRRAWENLKGLICHRIPLVYNAIAGQSVNIVATHHAVIVFNDEGALNTFTAFKERAESYFRQVFSLDAFTVEGTIDQSILTSLDPSTLSMSDFCVYLQQKNEAVGDLFKEFNLKAQ